MKNQRRETEFLASIDSSWKGHEHFALWLAKKMGSRTVVDLGFDCGLSTIAFAMGNRGHTFGIDWFGRDNYCKKTRAMDQAFRSIADALQMNLVKNIHLIVGPVSEASRSWCKEIDLLHIDWAHSHAAVKEQYEAWMPFLKEEGVLLLHDVTSQPEGTGRFFHELALPKLLFPHAAGLGVASRDKELLNTISEEWSEGLQTYF